MQRMSQSEAEKYKFKMKYPPPDIISYIYGQADQHEPQGNLKLISFFIFYKSTSINSAKEHDSNAQGVIEKHPIREEENNN